MIQIIGIHSEISKSDCDTQMTQSLRRTLLGVDVFLDQSDELKERLDLDALHGVLGCRHGISGAGREQEADLEWSLGITRVNGATLEATERERCAMTTTTQ